jgi:MarR-like DNA-binding transcriptional regulator SgrR of sgrS sRNA
LCVGVEGVATDILVNGQRHSPTSPPLRYCHTLTLIILILLATAVTGWTGMSTYIITVVKIYVIFFVHCKFSPITAYNNNNNNNTILYVTQRIDFDPDAEPVQRLVAAKVAKVEAIKVKKRIEEEQKVSYSDIMMI